jgi:peptidoglycan/xylan/chitin deacetylase (PgdA/CDA1 family)
MVAAMASPPASPARVRAGGTIHGHAAGPPALAPARALLLAVLGALALATGGAVAGRGAARVARAGGLGAGAASAASAPARALPSGLPAPAAVPPAKGLYRIVGCRSHGTGAYLHGPHVREVAIGFDDGPAADTGAFVTMLERARVQATFFMIGRQVSASYRPLLLRELRDGDVLGDHTFSHPDLLAGANVRGQLQSTLAAIRQVSGYTPCLFRPPYGAYDSSVVATARSLGLATVQWNVDPRDWAEPGTAAIVHTVLAEVQPGSIILSHDGGGPRAETLAAYPTIISDLRARGYRIVTIPQLLGFEPVYVPCIKLCDGIGVTRAQLPRGAILQRAP